MITLPIEKSEAMIDGKYSVVWSVSENSAGFKVTVANEIGGVILEGTVQRAACMDIRPSDLIHICDTEGMADYIMLMATLWNSGHILMNEIDPRTDIDGTIIMEVPLTAVDY